MPEISVIIATYNRSAILNEALKSVFSQKRIQDTEYEVIVVDNNSVDQTKNTVLAMMKDHSAGNLHYWFQPVQGKSAALNLGIEKAKGKIIAFTDDDVLVDKNWLSSIRDCFANTGCT